MKLEFHDVTESESGTTTVFKLTSQQGNRAGEKRKDEPQQ